jgi:hypothetical protein
MNDEETEFIVNTPLLDVDGNYINEFDQKIQKIDDLKVVEYNELKKSFTVHYDIFGGNKKSRIILNMIKKWKTYEKKKEKYSKINEAYELNKRRKEKRKRTQRESKEESSEEMLEVNMDLEIQEELRSEESDLEITEIENDGSTDEDIICKVPINISKREERPKRNVRLVNYKIESSEEDDE